MSDLILCLSILGIAYFLGVGHGLTLAWTQEARCKRWARWVERNFERIDAYLEDDMPQTRGPL